MLPLIIYWTSKTGNTKRFVEKLGFECRKLPCEVDRPFILVFPTFGVGQVPKPVHDFILQHHTKSLGVVACGNRAFGSDFALGGVKVSKCYGLPLLYKVELFGSDYEVEIVKEKINESYQLESN